MVTIQLLSTVELLLYLKYYNLVGKHLQSLQSKETKTEKKILVFFQPKYCYCVGSLVH